MVLSDLIAEDINAQPLAAIIKAWALVAKGQGPAGLSYLIQSSNANISGNKSAPAVFTMQAARMANYLGFSGEMLKLADQLFERNDLSSQLIIQLASLYARQNSKFEQLVEQLPDGFDKSKILKVLSRQTASPTISHHIAAGIIDTSLIASRSRNDNMLKARLGLALYLNPQSDRARFLIAQALSEINQKQGAKEQLAAIDRTGIWSQPRLLRKLILIVQTTLKTQLAICKVLSKDRKMRFCKKNLETFTVYLIS